MNKSTILLAILFTSGAVVTALFMYAAVFNFALFGNAILVWTIVVITVFVKLIYEIYEIYEVSAQRRR